MFKILIKTVCSCFGSSNVEINSQKKEKYNMKNKTIEEKVGVGTFVLLFR